MTTENAKTPYPLKTRLRRQTAIVSRWLHIYLSMVSFAVILFFAATGLTLNHPDAFASQQRTVTRHGATTPGDQDRLALVEMLRTREHLHGTVTDYRVESGQVQLSLRAAGYTADVFVDQATGKYDITEVSSGLVAVLNDLHRGHDTGKTWSRLIDLSAILLALVSLTGLILIWFVYKRRTSGLILAALATAAVLALYHFAVP